MESWRELVYHLHYLSKDTFMSESKTNEDDIKWSESNYRVEGEARDFIHEKFPALTHQQVLETVRSAGTSRTSFAITSKLIRIILMFFAIAALISKLWKHLESLHISPCQLSTVETNPV